jgi:NAD(P)-dependent dehydrogenase (short-subunit alcohol dehydrogenase family)
MTDSNGTSMDRRNFLGSLTFAAGASGLLGASSSVRGATPAPPETSPMPPPMILPQRAPLADVAGKTAYVTGASSGIGLGIARACYDAGMKVIIGYIDDSQIEEALTLFADKSRVHAIKHDVTDRPGWVRLADEAERKFGRVHLLVNNAGVGVRAMLSTSTYNDYDWGMAVNTTGVFNGIATFVPRMKGYGEGAHIVTTCSMSGILPGASLGVYTTSKFATCGMMEALRVELQNTNIGTSVYLPGGVNTNIRLSERYRQEQFRNAPAASAAPVAPPAQAAAAPRPANAPPAAPPAGMDPLEAGRSVLLGVRRNDLFIFSHPEFKDGMRERFESVLASIPLGREVPQARLAIERVTMRVPMYAAETAKLRADPVGPVS